MGRMGTGMRLIRCPLGSLRQRMLCALYCCRRRTRMRLFWRPLYPVSGRPRQTQMDQPRMV